ncbi:MAG: hypothetical protein ACYDC9_07690 [Dermatophilaceae bacterium]
MHKLTKKTLAVSAVLMLTGGGVAFAYWTTTGTGTATSTTAASLATLTTTQNGSVTGMAPGGAIQDVNFTINNSATTPQYVTTVAMSISGITYTASAGTGTGTTWVNHPAGGVAPGCTAADFTLTQPTAGIDVPNGGLAFTQAATPQKSGRIAMKDLATNQDDCKGTTVALAFAIS